MSAPRRPARLVVAGISWIVAGLMCAQFVVVFLTIALLPGTDRLGWAITGLGATLSGVTAVIGITAGIGLLRLRRWSRGALEALTWAYCVICAALASFGVYSFMTWPDPSDRWVPVISIVGYPLALVGFIALLWALRSRVMRDAVAGDVQQTPVADAAS
jgi:hypothetical protein